MLCTTPCTTAPAGSSLDSLGQTSTSQSFISHPIASENAADHLRRGRVAIEGKSVDGSAGQTRQKVLVSRASNVTAQRSGGLLALEGEKVGRKTGNMRRSHRSARDGVLEATHVSAKATKTKGITKAWFTHGSGGTTNPCA